MSSPHANHQGEPGDTGLERVRHLKRGTEYEVLGEAEAQISTRYESDRFGNWIGLYEGHTLVVYRCVETGKLWCRPPEEFRDGRFQTIASAPTPPDRIGEEVGRDPDRLLKDALFACLRSGTGGREYGGVAAEGGKFAWVRFSVEDPSPDPAGAGGDLGELADVQAALKDCSEAVAFFDQVKRSTQAEQIAVGADHWNWLEAACRRAAAALRTLQAAGEVRS